MYTELKIVEKLKSSINPNTKSSAGYRVAVGGGVCICALLWIVSLLSFSSAEMPSRDLEGIKWVIENRGYGFYVMVSALFWMILTFTMYDFPRLTGCAGLGYVLYATFQTVPRGEVGLYLPFGGIIVIILLINPILAGFRIKKQDKQQTSD